MPPRKKTTTTPKVKARSTKTSTKSTTPTSKQPARKPSAKKTATKKPTAKTSGKSTTTTPRKRKTTPKKPTLKRKQLTQEEKHPFSSFPYRLEYQDGKDYRICHFQTEEHRTKHIKRYGLRKNQYTTDDATS